MPDTLKKESIEVTKRTKQHLDSIHKFIFGDVALPIDYGDFVYILCCHYRTKFGLDKIKRKKKKK